MDEIPAKKPAERDLFSPFLTPGADVRKDARHLPHWRLDGAFYFLTWRLADSLPQEKLRVWKAEREAWLVKHPKPWSADTMLDYRESFPKRLESWLDAGYGACHLRSPRCAEIVADSLHHFDGERYDLASFVIMPNHVHALFQLRNAAALESVTHSWKSYSAKQINKTLGRSGTLWQQESWDHLLRGIPHLDRCLSYIALNPKQAKLPPGEFLYYEAPGFREFAGLGDPE